MNNNLANLLFLEADKLDSEHYFLSLIEQAANKKLLNAEDIERIQYECLALLAYKTERYNAGDSTSIRIEKAQELMASILFTLGVQLKSFPLPQHAVQELKNTSVTDIYNNGHKRIGTMLAATKMVYQQLLQRLPDINNVFYRDTLVGGITAFFKLYDPTYFAHKIHITADYPLYNPTPRLAGIEFIKAYVAAATYENRFCSFFDANDIHNLMCGYSQDYSELLINIYEIVLTTSLGCVLAGAEPLHLSLNAENIACITNKFTNKTPESIRLTVADAAAKLSLHLQLVNGVKQYVHNSLEQICAQIEVSAKRHTLDKIFFAKKIQQHQPQITFSFGAKMDDKLYRQLLAEIEQCRFFKDKTAIIKAQVHSLADLEDLMLDAAFSAPEMQSILSGLNISELAALANKYQINQNIDTADFREPEMLLHTCLKQVVAQLSAKNQELFTFLLAAMHEN